MNAVLTSADPGTPFSHYSHVHSAQISPPRSHTEGGICSRAFIDSNSGPQGSSDIVHVSISHLCHSALLFPVPASCISHLASG